MQKTRYVLQHFFRKEIVDILLPHLINSERTPLQGVEKKTLALAEIKKQLTDDNISVVTSEGNLSFPWRELFPLFIDSMLRALNILIGRDWIKEEEDSSAPPKS